MEAPRPLKVPGQRGELLQGNRVVGQREIGRAATRQEHQKRLLGPGTAHKFTNGAGGLDVPVGWEWVVAGKDGNALRNKVPGCDIGWGREDGVAGSRSREGERGPRHRRRSLPDGEQAPGGRRKRDGGRDHRRGVRDETDGGKH